MNYRIPEIAKKTAAEITDLTKYSIEIGKEDDLNLRSYSMLLSQLQTLIGVFNGKYNLLTITDDYNVKINDAFIYIDTTDEAIDITLPEISSSYHGKNYVFITKTDINNRTLLCSGSDTFSDSTTSFSIGQYVYIIADNDSKTWIIYNYN